MARYPEADILASSDHIVSTFALTCQTLTVIRQKGIHASSP